MEYRNWQASLSAIFWPIGIALALPVFADAVIWLGSGQPQRFFSQPSIKLFNMAWTAAPFLVWGVVCVVVKRFTDGYQWGVAAGLLLTFFGWIFVAWRGVAYQTGLSNSGADIGLGYVMLGLPVIVFALMFVASEVAKVKGG